MTTEEMKVNSYDKFKDIRLNFMNGNRKDSFKQFEFLTQEEQYYFINDTCTDENELTNEGINILKHFLKSSMKLL